MVRFSDAVGCCTAQPLPGYPSFPSQQAVIEGIDPLPSDLWFWKDDLHIEKRLYYTRVFGGRPGFISNSLLPVLIATNGAVIDELLFEGALSPEAQQVYRTIDEYGPIGTRNLKRLLTPDARRNANSVLIDLDRRFLITKTGLTGRTRGTYSYIWDLIERWLPDMLTAAGRLGRKKAEAILREHLTSYEVPSDSAFYSKILRWDLQI